MNASCDRFEREGILQLERGEPLDPHYAGCAHCRAAQAAHERLLAALQHPRTETPRAGWEQRVLAAIDAPPAPAPRRTIGGRAALGIAAAAAVLIAVSVGQLSLRAPPGLELEVVAAPGAPLRGTAPHAGDRLRLKARAGGAPHAELRIFRNDRELVLRCPGGILPCERRGDALTAELSLPAIGAYQALLATSQSPLPPPAATLDEDAARLMQAGARVTLSQSLRVY